MYSKCLARFLFPLFRSKSEENSEVLNQGSSPKLPCATGTSMYTCITCRVAFTSGGLQRAHYKTDWHRYNLKRKVAELPPVSAEGFQERVLLQRTIDQSQQEKVAQVCRVCHKHFSSKKSHESHLRSKKHKEVVAALERLRVANLATKTQPFKGESGEFTKQSEGLPQSSAEDAADKEHGTKSLEEEDEESSDGDPEPLDITECLFCPECAVSVEDNLEHMGEVHGFFIPDLEYLVDLEGLLGYLGGKVGVDNLCLYCNQRGKSFYSVEAARHHMIDCCHCKLFFEGDAALEYAEFYDYSKSYPDHDKAGDRSNEVVVPSESALVVGDELELILPSGTSIGHRALKHLYKQRLPSYERQKALLMSRIMAKYRAIGSRSGHWEGSTQIAGNHAWVEKMRRKRELKISMKGNNQKHFRPQVIF